MEPSCIDIPRERDGHAVVGINLSDFFHIFFFFPKPY